MEVAAESAEEEREKENTAAMFYSHCLLAKNGPLSAVWVAACCFKRLKKRQIIDTQIPSSVDTILLKGLPYVTYRILAYLLLGVVRIYSRKVECLSDDCHEAVRDLNRFSAGKKVVPLKSIIRSSHSIILPERYELDSFQLEVADVASGGDVSRSEDFILQDAGREKFLLCSADKHSFEEITLHRKENYAETSAWLTLLQETCSSAQTPQKLSTDCGESSIGFTPPDKVLSPHQMEVDTELCSLDPIKSSQTSKEKLRELRFTQEGCMGLDMICEADIELLNLINDYQFQNVDEGDGNALEKLPLEKDDHVVPEEIPSTAEKTPDLDGPNAREFTEDKELPSTADKTLDSGVPDVKGATAQELLVLPTPPAKKENIRRPCKRKCMIDVPTVLDNQLMKQTIKYASDLVCKGRKAPHTTIDIWRLSRTPSLSKNFSEPLIPCFIPELRHAHQRKRNEKPEPTLRIIPEPIEVTEEPADKPEDVVSPRTPTNSRSAIAPGTPVICPTYARVFASPRGGDSDGEGPFHPFENITKESSMHEEEKEEDSGPNLMDEVEGDEGDSEEHTSKNGLSARTRTVAKYLHIVIHEKKQQGEASIPLLPILERKTRAQNARFFFEILVLSTGGFVNVKQDRAYENVILQETPKMEATFVNC